MQYCCQDSVREDYNEEPEGVDSVSSTFNHSSTVLYRVCYPLTTPDLRDRPLCLLSPHPNRWERYRGEEVE